jgi:hypothetical protein
VTTTVALSVAPLTTYSKIDCSTATYCNIDLTNGATNVYVNLNSAIGAVSSPHIVSISCGTERKENNYIIFPVIDAKSSSNVNVNLLKGIDVFVDCSLSLNCQVTL